MKNVIVASFGSLAIAGAASAAFNGIHVNEYFLGSSFIADVYAGFTTTDDVLLNVYNVQANFSSGWDAMTHNNLFPGPSWSPQLVTSGMGQFDSFVTIGGMPSFNNSSQADPNWGAAGLNQAGIPSDAGWFNSNPPNLQGKAEQVELVNLLGESTYSGAATMVMRLVVELSAIDNGTTFSFAGALTFNQGLGTPPFQPLFDFSKELWQIPSPGAGLLLGLACLSTGRRRRQ